MNIQYFGGCAAQKCKPIQLGTPDSCAANFETPAATTVATGKYFIAQPWHNHNKKPVRICWTFGDGRDTCIQYPTNFTGTYGVFHNYNQHGAYNVCVNILYDGGCQATKCKLIVTNRPDSCKADFERIPTNTSATPLLAYFKAIPQHSNNKSLPAFAGPLVMAEIPVSTIQKHLQVCMPLVTITMHQEHTRFV